MEYPYHRVETRDWNEIAGEQSQRAWRKAELLSGPLVHVRFRIVEPVVPDSGGKAAISEQSLESWSGPEVEMFGGRQQPPALTEQPGEPGAEVDGGQDQSATRCEHPNEFVRDSQRIVDVLLGALAKALPDRIPAASAGTMSNLMIHCHLARSMAL